MSQYKLQPSEDSDVYDDDDINIFKRQLGTWDDPRPVIIKELFQEFRKQRFVTIEGDICCGSCGSYDASTRIKELQEAGEEPLGYVFYHIQGISNWGRSSIDFDFSSVMLYYGGNDSDTNAKDVGDMIAKILDEFDVEYEWDGDSATAIEVFPG